MTRRDVLSALQAALLTLAARLDVRAQAPPTASPAEITELTLIALVSEVHAGRLSPRDVADAYLARIAARNEGLGAFVTVTGDVARRQAARAASSGSRLALAGAPIAHKDLFETAGIRTTGGSRLYERHVPAGDATLVSRLGSAGAVMLGKTNTHELGGGVTTINPFFGTTRNPHDRDRIAGGSSGGSAAAVAGRLVVAATGTDTGGSVRIPAAMCGCVGFKPTFGLLSTAGVLGASPTFDHAGLLTRSVADVVPLLLASMGIDAADPGTVPAIPLDAARPTLRGVRVGVPRGFFFDRLDAPVARAMDEALAAMGRAGATVRDIRTPVDAATMARVFDPIAIAEIHQTYARDWQERPQLFSPGFAGFFTAPLPTALDLAAAHRARLTFQAEMTRVFDAVDVLATPTVAVVAPRITGQIDGELILRNTWPFNAARMPAISIPCAASGLPVGLQLAGRPFGDAALLSIAGAVEPALGSR